MIKCDECLAIGMCHGVDDEITQCEVSPDLLDLKESSCFKEAQYFPNLNELYVKFHGGVVGLYTDVKSNVIDDWKLADSSGSFFSKNIRNVYSYRKVD